MRTEFFAEEVLALCGLLSVLMLHDLSAGRFGRVRAFRGTSPKACGEMLLRPMLRRLPWRRLQVYFVLWAFSLRAGG